MYLTSTLQLGRVYDSACRIELEKNPSSAEDFIIPVVAECDDSYLNDARRMQTEHEDVVAAWDAALASRGSSTPPDEGAVGSGTGMSCFDFKGGIGTASRRRRRAHRRRAAHDQLRRREPSARSTVFRSGGCSARRRRTAHAGGLVHRPRRH